ncbi:MAG: Hpt domain-containing protein [Candidatus Binataceae bacterium]
MTEPLTIEIDPDLSDLIPGFLARKRTDLKTILESVQSGNFELIGQIAHRLKGEGGSFGIEAISEAGRRIEAAARAREADAITAITCELLAYLDSVHIVYAPASR